MEIKMKDQVIRKERRKGRKEEIKNGRPCFYQTRRRAPNMDWTKVVRHHLCRRLCRVNRKPRYV